MNLRAEILQASFPEDLPKIIKSVGEDAQCFAELIEMLLESQKDYRPSQKALRLLLYYTKHHPEYFDTHLERIILNLKNPVRDTVKRNTLRLLEELEIPEAWMGEAANICFELLESADTAIAIKVFAMTVLYHISLKEPDLQSELKIILENQMPYGSAGFKSRAKKILKAIAKNQPG